MFTTPKTTAVRTGFTLVELLTVMAIIALLIGLMVPAMAHVKTTAKIVQQKAQLKAIETALESFSAAYGEYPDSKQTSLDHDATWLTGGSPTANTITCGAQKLAEAVVGCDLRGFDPRASSFNSTSGAGTGTANFDRLAIEGDKGAYAVAGVPTGTVQADVDASLNRRKGPYLTVNENVNSFELGDIYGYPTTSPLYQGGQPGWTGNVGAAGAAAKKFGNVICDNFKAKTITYKTFDYATNAMAEVTVKVGTPILYFKADPSKKKLDGSSVAAIEDSIYNYHDNMWLVELGKITDSTKKHYWADTTNPAYTNAPSGWNQPAAAFYSYIQNPKINTGRWPYNAESFMLISAGPDGIYGNADDITNFSSMDMK